MGKSFSNGKMWNCANRSMGEWGSGEMGRGANEQMEHGEVGNYGTGKRQGEKVEWGTEAIGSWHSPFGTDRKQHRNRHARMHVHRKSPFKFCGLWVQPPN